MGLHKHVPLLNGKASACQEYPEPFCKLICEAVRKEISDIKWCDRVTKSTDITKSFEDLVQCVHVLEDKAQYHHDYYTAEGVQGGIGLPADEAHGRNSVFGPSLRSMETTGKFPSPPHEDDDLGKYHELYRDSEFVDDISGAPLNKELATTARKDEIVFFKHRGVYTKRKRESWMTVTSTKWIDQNKGDAEVPKYRARLVGREIARKARRHLCGDAAAREPESDHLALCKQAGGDDPIA